MLIAHYPLNGDARDYFGNGTDSGNLVFDQGIIGQGCYFNNDEQISSNINDTGLGRFTFCTWFKKVGSSWGSSAIAGTRSGNTGWMLYRNSGDTNGYFRWYMHYRTTSGGISSYNAWPGISGLSNDSWYHITVTRSHNGYSDIYLDGVLVSHSTPPNDFKTWAFSSNDMRIGRDSSGYTGGGFILDDFKIYDHALSEKEVSDLSKGISLSWGFSIPGAIDSSGNGFNGTFSANSPEWIDDADMGGCYRFSGDESEYIANTDLPEHKDNFTYCLWLKRVSTDGRQYFMSRGRDIGYFGVNIFANNNGVIRVSYGDNTSKVYLYHSNKLSDNEWHHLVFTYSEGGKFYIDGQLVDSGIAKNISYDQSGGALVIGKMGHEYTSTNNYFATKGYITDVRVYATALSADDIKTLYKTGLSIDNIGNIHGKYLAESGIVNPNILDYTTWTIGTNGSQSGFSANGGSSDNKIVSDIDPFGKEVTVWETIGEPDSDDDGGWDSSYFPIDETKFYRFSVWIRRTVIGNGSTYFGLRGGSLIRRDSGGSTTNPYFWNGGWGFDVDEWVLLVAHAWPSGSGTGADHVDSGRYTVTDGRVANIYRDYVIPVGRTSLTHRAYLYYSTDVSTIQQFLYPRVDVLDGTEPSVQALLGGFDSINQDRITELGSSSVPDKPSIKYDKLNVGQFSEVGISRGLVSWIPLIGDTKDRVTNEVATNNGAISVADGYVFDGSGEIDGSPTGSYIAIPEAITNTSNYPQGCTYSVWLNVDTDAVDRMSLFRGGGSINHIEIRSISKNFRTEAATQNGYSFGSGNFPDDVRGVWSNFTIVFANGETGRPVRWYQNGKLFHTGSMTGGSNPEGEYFSFNDLGRATGTGSYTYAKSFDGKIRGFRIYENTLTPEEIAQEYNSGKASLNKNSAFAKEFIEV